MTTRMVTTHAMVEAQILVELPLKAFGESFWVKNVGYRLQLKRFSTVTSSLVLLSTVQAVAAPFLSNLRAFCRSKIAQNGFSTHF